MSLHPPVLDYSPSQITCWHFIWLPQQITHLLLLGITGTFDVCPEKVLQITSFLEMFSH